MKKLIFMCILFIITSTPLIYVIKIEGIKINTSNFIDVEKDIDIRCYSGGSLIFNHHYIGELKESSNMFILSSKIDNTIYKVSGDCTIIMKPLN